MSSLHCYGNTDANQTYFFGMFNLFLVNGLSSLPDGALTMKYQPFKFGKVCPCKTEMSHLNGHAAVKLLVTRSIYIETVHMQQLIRKMAQYEVLITLNKQGSDIVMMYVN